MTDAPPPPEHTFASDNAAGVHPLVMAALAEANHGHAVAYGDDLWTHEAVDHFRVLFGSSSRVLLVWGGTGANVVALQSLLGPHEAVVCAATAHINVDECGAPERFLGAKLIDLPTDDGKLTPEHVESVTSALGDVHHVQPGVVSITQSTEMGTVYTVDEVAALCDAAHFHGMRVHVDGARIANAAASLGVGPRAFTFDVGVDAVSFGGTKNGMMYGEAVVFPRVDGAPISHFLRKQAAQLPSKMRFVAAQFNALLTDDLWLRTASHANEMAALLAERAGAVDGVELCRPPQANGVFARLPLHAIEHLQSWSYFYTWDEAAGEVRWMASWDTLAEDVDAFVAGLEHHLRS